LNTLWLLVVAQVQVHMLCTEMVVEEVLEAIL
jgi:hypothetical protein